jgi:pyruvate dehydrogenase E2 component (dihydrolipoamide acetyltransferase)
MTVTNLGERGVETVFPVIIPPQVAMVGFGTITEQAVAVRGMLDVRPAVDVSLAADHRVTDGHRGSTFLNTINQLLQDPGGPMNIDQAKSLIFEVLADIAPEVDPAGGRPHR